MEVDRETERERERERKRATVTKAYVEKEGKTNAFLVFPVLSCACKRV